MAYTIRQYTTKSGKRYEVRYRKPDGTPTGKRGFRRKMDAEAWGDQHVNAAKRDGSFVDQSAGRTLVSDVYAEWMDSRRPILKPNTIRTDEITWKTHVEPEYAARQIGSITQQRIAGLCQRQGGKTGTVHGAQDRRRAQRNLRSRHQGQAHRQGSDRRSGIAQA
ncbi:MAG: hypothetical protein ACLR5C_00015 [Bifidobacterium adolescentis]